MKCRAGIAWIVLPICLLTMLDVANGQLTQPRASSPKIPTTELEFELLSEGGLHSGLTAQKWGRTFQELGVPLRVRRPILGDKPGVREQKFGTIRRATAIGGLDETGRIIFPGRSFTLADTACLAEWIRELRTYGAQGSPVGKPAFGLSPAQFNAVYTALSAPLETELKGKTVTEALAPRPDPYALRFSDAASQRLRSPQATRVVTQPLTGLSTGTGLAALLNDAGLGFRPLRTPSGAIELVVEPLEEGRDHWPVGWELPEDASRLQLAPKFFKLVPMELDDVPLKDVLDAVSVAAEIPILVDNVHIEQIGLDLGKMRVSLPSRQASWSLLLRAATNPNKLTRRLLLDEAGRPFVWIMPLRLALRDRRPAPKSSRH